MEDNRTEKRKTGDLGENVACKFLVKHGFEIIEQNYNKKWGEIDIIARKGQKLHFVEVKSVSHLPHIKVKSDGTGFENDYYQPEDNLHPWKLKRLSRVIQTYLLNCKNNPDWQFDVAIVYLDFENRQAKVNLLEDIIL